MHSLRFCFSLSMNTSLPYEILVVCPNKHCQHVYGLEDAMRIKNCDRQIWPEHVQVARRVKCNTELLRRVRVNGTSPAKYVFVPNQTFGCTKLCEEIKGILSDDETLEHVLNGPSRRSPDGVFADIYDGSWWNSSEWASYLSTNTNLALQMNLDWFNPFRRVQYSAGALYLAILNLPLSMRYKCVGEVDRFVRDQ